MHTRWGYYPSATPKFQIQTANGLPLSKVRARMEISMAHQNPFPSIRCLQALALEISTVAARCLLRLSTASLTSYKNRSRRVTILIANHSPNQLELDPESAQLRGGKWEQAVDAMVLEAFSYAVSRQASPAASRVP